MIFKLPKIIFNNISLILFILFCNSNHKPYSGLPIHRSFAVKYLNTKINTQKKYICISFTCFLLNC